MFFKILIKYLLGYINIKVEGYFVEKFINKCTKENIFFWNVEKDNSTTAYMNVGISDFKKLCKIAKSTKCKTKILKKKGLPFLLNKYKKRKMIVIIIIAIIILLGFTSKYIWNIKVEGLEENEKEEIILLLNENGIKRGLKKSKIKTEDSINEIRLKREDISWIGMKIEGTNLIVEITKAKLKPEIIDEMEYCNIVATRDAQIIKVSAQNGIPLVKKDELVRKGDILIAGWIEGKYTGTRYMHAKGEVKAKVWHTEKETIKLKDEVKKETGEVEEKYKIKINNFPINLYKTLSKFEKYDTIETCKQLKIFSNFYLPIEFIKIMNKEIINEEINYEIEEAKSISIEKASKKIEENLTNNQQVLKKYVNTKVTENEVEAEVTYEVLENIGTKEKIVF